MKKLLFLFLLVPVLLYGQTIPLSNAAQISVITCGPGQEEVFTAFGHSALRVYDPENNIDYVYNYGVFDFDQPNFYLNYTKGHLHFKLARMDWPRFRDNYIYFDRSVTEQVLDLATNDKQKLFEFLEWNNLPENQFYYYDYFYDNCATRIRDALANTFEERLVFDGSYITTDKTIRILTDDYLGLQPWGDLGIDICLGLPMDKKATPWMYMFLPDYVKSGLDHATLKTENSELPIVKETIIVYESKGPSVSESLLKPVHIFWGVFLILALVSYFDFKKQKTTRIVDILWFSVLGFFGVFLLALWLGTDHRAAAWNMNLLWAFPFHAAGVVFIVRKNTQWIVKYFRFVFWLSIALAVFWFFLPQLMHYALFPMALGSAVRGFLLYKFSGR